MTTINTNNKEATVDLLSRTGILQCFAKIGNFIVLYAFLKN